VRAERWPLSEREISSLINQLCFDYFKWDAEACGKRLILPEALVLSARDHAEVVAICERFDRILRDLEAAILTRPDLLARLGIPSEVLPLLPAEQPDGMQLARYDVFQTQSGAWLISEFNEDVPGGFNEADGIPRLLGGKLGGAAFTGDLRRAVVDSYAGLERIALLYATGYSEDLQHMLIIKRWLEEEGHSTVLAAPAHLESRWRRPEFLGQRVDAAFRFYPGEWFRWLPNLQAWRKCLPRLPMMNPLRRLIRQSKRLYAIWNEPGLISAEDLAFVQQHTPATLPFEKVGDQISDRERWVLKHAFGRMGDAVVMGNLAADKVWNDTVIAARKAPSEWLLQERFDVAPLQDGGHPFFPSLGVYLVNQRFAGYYSRAAYKPFINHEAYHVATVVETA